MQCVVARYWQSVDRPLSGFNGLHTFPQSFGNAALLFLPSSLPFPPLQNSTTNTRLYRTYRRLLFFGCCWLLHTHTRTRGWQTKWRSTSRVSRVLQFKALKAAANCHQSSERKAEALYLRQQRARPPSSRPYFTFLSHRWLIPLSASGSTAQHISEQSTWNAIQQPRRCPASNDDVAFLNNK